jgi:hypothetical protein
MIEFEDFVKGLGPYAKHYTPEQLKQLHVEVRKLAQALLEAHRSRKAKAEKGSSPQPGLDRSERTVH